MKFLSLVTGSTNAVVTTAEAKTFLKVDTSDDDALIDGYVSMATTYLENYTNRSFLTSTWQLSLDVVDTNVAFIELPRTPLGVINSVKYWDNDDAEQTWASSNYEVDKTKQPGRLFLADGGMWPTDMRSIKAMVIEFTAGWGDATANIDAFYSEIVQTAVKTVVAGLYDDRSGLEGKFGESTTTPAKRMVESLRVLTL